MYIPAPFREDRLDELHEAIRQQSFATLIFERTGWSDRNPLAASPRANPRSFRDADRARGAAKPSLAGVWGQSGLPAIFQGPHAYVSPTWYTTPYAVPTWNYTTVHAYGRPKLIEDDAELYRIVAELVRVHEGQFAYAWDLEAQRGYAEKLLKNIVGFTFEILRLEGKAQAQPEPVPRRSRRGDRRVN